jgi:hypothetical protein
MGQNRKQVVAALAFISIWLFSATNAFPQPFGLGSSPAQQEPRQEILNTAGGRFVFGQISDSTKDQFMLDTVTGRLWQIAETGELGTFLRAVPYRRADGKLSPIPEDISDSAEK